jgi:hypothetical protein
MLLRGSESWSTQEKHVSRITATEMRCYRKIVGKTKRDRLRSERIREQVGRNRKEEYLKKDSSNGSVTYTEWKERENQSSLWRLRKKTKGKTKNNIRK